MSKTKATFCVLAAGILWGCISLFTRALNAAGLGALEISAIRMLVGAVGMAAIILATDRSCFRVRLRDLWMFIGTGVVGVTLFNTCYFTVIQLSEASIAVVLLYTSPVFVMLLSALFFKERITSLKVVALVLTMAGCVLVTGVLGGGVRLGPKIVTAGLASGFFYATYSIFGRKALTRYSNKTVTFYTFAAGAVVSLALCDTGSLVHSFAATPSAIAWGVGIGLACTIAPYLFYNAGLENMETSRAGILATVEPLVGAVLGIAVYGESAGILKLAGIALIFASVVLLSLPQSAGKQRE